MQNSLLLPSNKPKLLFLILAFSVAESRHDFLSVNISEYVVKLVKSPERTSFLISTNLQIYSFSMWEPISLGTSVPSNPATVDIPMSSAG